MVKKTFIITLFLTIFLTSLTYGAQLSSYSLGDTVFNKPQIIEYFYGDSIEGISAEAFLNDEQLEVNGIYNVKDMSLKTNYLFLIDESTSISSSQMSRIRQAVNSAIDTLKPNETMSIIAFGENIEIRADHSQDVTQLKNAVATLNNNQGGTVFYNVIKKAEEVANTRAGERNLVFIISDGIDFNTGGYNYDEIEKLVKESDLTLYAVALGSSSNTYIEKFGQLARTSYGAIEVCGLETIDDGVLKLLQRARSGYAVVLNSKSNNISNNVDKLIITFKYGDEKTTLEKNISATKWVKDTVAPTMVSADKTSETSIDISFSEDVLGADKVENFKILLNGKHELKADGVKYDSTNHKATLVFERGVFNGEHSISCLNITDNSMEKNPLSQSFTFNVSGRSYEAYLLENAVMEYWLLILIIALVIAGVIAYIVISRRKGIVIHEKKIKFKDTMVDKEVVVTPEITNISLLVTNGAGLNRRIDMKMYKSLIVGRSQMSDLVFDDPSLSRQHFAIEEQDGIYTIMNLSSTNGTTVNGVLVTGKRKLEHGDVIIAGNERFVFNSR